jgi:hypothetical protein
MERIDQFIGTWIGVFNCRESGSRMRFLFAVVLALVGVAMLPSPTIAAAPPQIGVVSAGVSENTAQLSARIRPNGLPTTYEAWLRYTACASGAEGAQCEPTVLKMVGKGFIPADHIEEAVNVPLSSLNWSYTYTFWVTATNPDGSAASPISQFTTSASPPPGAPGGSGGGAPYESKEEAWIMEGAERRAQEAPRLEAERLATQREASERAAREAAEREAKEHELVPQKAAPICIVPSLTGNPLATAQARLRKAHCKLGHVVRPRRYHGYHGVLVVIGQGRRRGARLPGKTAVAIRLGYRRSAHH